MTTKELNRDIKRLANEFYRLSFGDTDIYNAYKENEGKTEFMRLYRADSEGKYMSHKSMLQLFRINLRHRYIPLHSFGIQWPFLIQ